MTVSYVLSYQSNWLYVYVPLDPQFVVKRLTIEYVLLLPAAMLHHICGSMVPGK